MLTQGGRMFRRERRLKVYRAQLDLVTLRHQQTRRSLSPRRGLQSGIRQWEIRKQRRLFAHATKIAY